MDLDQHTPPAPEPKADAGVVETSVVPDSFTNFWVDDARVYMSGENLQSCVYAQCNEMRITYAPSGLAFALSGTDVFFSGRSIGTDLFACPKAGCAGGPRQVFSDTITLFNVTTDADYLYWSSAFDIYRCPLGNCGEIPQFVAEGETARSTLLVRGGTAFWSADVPPDANGMYSSASRIRSAPKDGSRAPETLRTAELGKNANQFSFVGNQFDVDDTSLYWIEASGKVLRCPLTGCGDAAPTTLFADSAQKSDIHVDDGGLYWLEVPADGSGELLRFCPKVSCAVPVSLTAATISNFALDSKYVYWDEVRSTPYGDAPGNRIHRMLKPAP